MRIRARNRLKGIIVTAAITNEAVNELGLKTRQEAYANVNASDVKVGLDN